MSEQEPWLAIVGIGEDGWASLSEEARTLIQFSKLLYGAPRHLALIPESEGFAERIEWPSPMSIAVREILTQHRGRRKITVLASGDPMLFGVGVTLTRELDPSEFRVVPQTSSFSLACARLGWPLADTVLVSLVNRPLEQVLRHLYAKQRLVIFSEDGTSPAALARLLTRSGYGASTFHVFENLGGPQERHLLREAATWDDEPCGKLNLIAVLCIADATSRPRSLVPGMPDDAFQTDGQLTKREVRSISLASLAPLPGQLLWDIGAGTGSIAIEWMRVHPACRAIAIEARADRAAKIRANARKLGTPSLRVIEGAAPAILAGIDSPDAIFIGGGASNPGVFEACWAALPSGGRLVINAVTIPSEAKLVGWHTLHGGDLVRIAISRAEPIGTTIGFRPMMPITQWAVKKQ